METSRDKITETGGTASIRLRYSRQFQNSGHTHTIDAETALAVGTSPETREQVLRELELSVEQLARQIVQRGSRPAGEAYPQTSARPGAATSRSTESPAPQSALPRPASQEAQPTAPLPVSESMPATPIASGGRTINLPYFIDYIKKRWNMSRQEAMELLDVRELTGLNLRDALYTLRAIKEPNSAANSGSAQARTAQQPVVEAPRQQNRSTPTTTSNSRPLASQSAPDTAPVTRPAGTTPTAFEPTTSSAPRAIQTATVPEPARTAEREHESRPDFAGSSKAPLPIKLGVVRDLAPRSPSYSFEEEDGDEYALPEDNTEADERLRAAEGKLETLRNTRGDSAASPERLNVLNNVLGSQISEEQLKQLIKAVWGFTGKKRLKVDQVEALIYWAKEDYFAEEVEKLLELLDEGEE